jgi:hypothetical protein
MPFLGGRRWLIIEYTSSIPFSHFSIPEKLLLKAYNIVNHGYDVSDGIAHA